MKLWQILAATIIFKSADFAFTAAFLLPSDYKFPPILYLACWLFGSIVVWLLFGLFSGEKLDLKEGFGDGLSQIPPSPPRDH